MNISWTLSFLDRYFQAVEQNVWRIFSPELTLKLFIITHVELSHFDVVEKGPSTIIYSVVVKIVSCMNMIAFVCNEANQPIVSNDSFDGMIAQQLLYFPLLMTKSIDVQYKNLRFVGNSCYLHWLFGFTLFTFVILIQWFFSSKLKVLLGAVGIYIGVLRIFELPLTLTWSTVNLISKLSSKDLIESIQSIFGMFQLVLNVLE